jgi:hypothetical protein
MSGSRLWGLALVALVAACAAPPPGTSARALATDDPPPLSLEAWLSLAGDPSVVAVHDDVALVCARPTVDGDAVAARCDAAEMARDGSRAFLGRDDLMAVGRLDPNRLVLATVAGALMIRTGDGVERAIATHAADPRLTSLRRIVAFTQYSADARDAQPAAGKLVALDLDRGARWVIADDPLASSPAVALDGRRAVYVSARTGLASLYVVAPGQAPRQLTNVGKREVDDDFVPVPGREWIWLDERRAVYTATYGGNAWLWAIDVDTGRAAPLRPGRRPRRAGTQVEAVTDDQIVAISVAEIAARLEVSR